MSSSNRICVKDLSVERLRGIQRDEDAVRLSSDRISEYITLVYGPNGSGKSTTALALQSLFWPGLVASDYPTLRGGFRAGEEEWRTEIFAGHPSCRREGAVVNPGSLPVSGDHKRYLLDLTDLLTSSDEALADHIRRELNGGYDLVKASEDCGAAEKIPASSIREVKELKNARKRYRDALERQLELRRREERMSTLRIQEQQALDAKKEADALQLVIDWRQADWRKRVAEEQLAEYPEGVARINEEHLKRLNEIWEKVEEQQKQREQAQARRQKAEKDLNATGLQQELVTSVRLKELENLRQQVVSAEEQISTCDHELAGKRKKEQSLRQRLAVEGTDLTEEQLQQLDSTPRSELFDFARSSLDLEAKEHACAQLRSVLAGYPEAESQRLSTLAQGVEKLRNWLLHCGALTVASSEKMAVVVLCAVAVGGGLTVLAAVAHGVYWLFLLLLPFGMAGCWAGYLFRKAGKRRLRMHNIAEDYNVLGLAEPSSWQDEAGVRNKLEELEKEYDEQRLYKRIDEIRTHNILPEEQRLENEKQEIEKRREEIQERVGAAPDLDDTSFAAFMQIVGEWQQVRSDIEEWEEKRRNASEQRDKCLARINEELQQYGSDQAENADEVNARVQEIHQRADRYSTVKEEMDAAAREIEQCDERIKEEKQARTELLHFLGLEDAQDASGLYEQYETVQEWLSRKPGYEQLQDQRKEAEAKCKEQQTALQAYSEVRGEWYEIPVQDLEARMQQQRSKADEYERVHDEITRIETEVGKAKQEHDVEEALAQVREAEQALTERRERTCQAFTGASLLNYIQTCTRRQTSRVLPRAERIFAELTDGRYELLVEERNGTAAFTARNTVTQGYHDLNSLSSGERIQLLLAARLAFVEQEEEESGSLRVPLIFDEVLANSDDDAANAIIHAVSRLASRGRQIFYFTAQKDEVAKWQAHLQKSEIPFKAVTLPDQSVEPDLMGPTYLANEQDLSAVPVPDHEDDYRSYGRRLGVPRLDPWQDVSGWHVWYFLDDKQDLYRLVRAGIRYWGPLQKMIQEDEASLCRAVGLQNGSEVFRLACARAEIWQKLVEKWRIGRGKPVSREVLRQSAAITEKFVDKVEQLAQELHYDPGALVEGLRAGRVSNFRKNKIEAFAEELSEAGYLDVRAPLSEADLRSEALKTASSHIEQGILDVKEVENMLTLTLQLE